jgi:menaquinone-dependent protoporphyrinogen oxidase
MRVLVAVASRHDATHGIAEAIGRTLAGSGLDVDVRRLGNVSDVAGYQAVVLGSAVYMGQWLEPARDFVDVHADVLAERPTWLFSSGPIGDPPRPAGDDAVKIDEVVAKTGAREHHVFAGKIDKAKLGFGERAVMLAFRAPEGDFRDWDAIAAWAASIAGALRG